ncbi:Hpt domain-containing protein [Steroidobacter flavus]|uniref:Hpt domain-containing protein n=1 Tax=Steroidobacter flavus TaxID=1842136 RepID=A0ABV8SKZ5_9GAMM
MNQAAVLDRKHLLEMTDGDAEFERELISAYRDSAQGTLARLRTALSAGQLTQVIREAHFLKGASLNIGATAMARCAGAIEQAARAGDLTLAREQSEQLDAQEAALWAELDRL